jgi:Ca-activated chloride channel family protein
VSFQSPWWLLLLVAVPAVVLLYVALQRRREREAGTFANPDLMPNVVDRSPGRLRHLPAAVFLIGLVALIVGVARPHANLKVPRELATVVLAVDTSRSMAATDVKPSRLDAAKKSALDFVDKVPKKFRIGVVAFASTARVVSPATADRTVPRQAIAQMRPGEGTAIGEAIVRSLQAGGAKKGSTIPVTILLISDGKQEGGGVSAAQAARRAKALKVPIYTVALGTPNGVVEVRRTGGFIERIQVPPDPATLKAIANTTGGKFFEAPDQKQLGSVYDELASRLGHRTKNEEITFAFGGAGALLMLAGGALAAALFRRLP